MFRKQNTFLISCYTPGGSSYLIWNQFDKKYSQLSLIDIQKKTKFIKNNSFLNSNKNGWNFRLIIIKLKSFTVPEASLKSFHS